MFYSSSFLRTTTTTITPSCFQFSIRGMATEKQILSRINGTTNIAKITKSMKMVAASKMRGAERRMKIGRTYTDWLQRLGEPIYDIEKNGLMKTENQRNLYVVITSDRGLCGGCNSQVSRYIRKQLNKNDLLFIIGEKGRAQLNRDFGNQILGDATDVWGITPNFDQAAALAEGVLTLYNNYNTLNGDDKKIDNIYVVFNKFLSAIAYHTSVQDVSIEKKNDTVKTKGTTAADTEENQIEPLVEYEMEPDNRQEMIQDLREYFLTNAIFRGMTEASASEESARMAAMGNATTNAEELISSLRLKYNKARQARITTELIEIISGASSLDEKN